MRFFFADDARQANPSREGMGPLVAIGGFSISGKRVRDTEQAIDELCRQSGFPPREEFKWSPGRELWMHDALVEKSRREFFLNLLQVLETNKAEAIVVVEDSSRGTAIQASPNAEIDATRLFLERVGSELNRKGSDGVVIVDRPSGERSREDAFLSDCLEMIQSGTDYVTPERVALNVLSTPSRLVRLVQAADVITSCSLAHIAGESTYSPRIFEAIKPLLCSDYDRIGGVGFKIQPDFLYANLYHWVLGDEYFVRYQMGTPLPFKSRPYPEDPDAP
jgi:hypothetical protein